VARGDRLPAIDLCASSDRWRNSRRAHRARCRDDIVGNAAAGRLLQRGVAAPTLLYCGFAAMPRVRPWHSCPRFTAAAVVQYIAVLIFSMLGGLVPATLFALSVRLAPDGHTVATTVGWMQQLFGFGSVHRPSLVAWVANRVGDWHWTWVVTGVFSAAGVLSVDVHRGAAQAAIAARAAVAEHAISGGARPLGSYPSWLFEYGASRTLARDA